MHGWLTEGPMAMKVFQIVQIYAVYVNLIIKFSCMHFVPLLLVLPLSGRRIAPRPSSWCITEYIYVYETLEHATCVCVCCVLWAMWRSDGLRKYPIKLAMHVNGMKMMEHVDVEICALCLLSHMANDVICTWISDDQFSLKFRSYKLCFTI